MKLKLNYLMIPLMVVGVLLIGKWFSHTGMVWYDTLVLPSLTPTKLAFPVIWHILAIFTSVALLLFYNRSERDLMFWIILILFGTNGILNLAWTKVFFGLHNIGVAFLIAVALEFNLIALVSLMYKRHKLAALLLVPYMLWVLFAVYLNWRVWVLN